MDTTTLKTKTDAELVKLSQQSQSDEAYAELIQRHYTRSLSRACAILPEPADAEDAVQDALLRALMKLDQLHNPAAFGAWLDRIVVSTCLNKLRRHQSGAVVWDAEDDMPEQMAHGADDPEANTLAQEREAAVADAINQLPPRYRDPVRLFHFGGQSYQHIAVVLGLPLGTVRSLISRAREKLEVLLKPYARAALFAF
ncbi:MAG: sigma-70 family RNA polymerase sigma factor [Pseudomonadota bacterium]